MSEALYSPEAEMAALGVMLLSEGAAQDGASGLSADDFYRPGNRLVFQAMQAIVARRQPIDMLTLPEELKRAGTLEAAGGADYLTDLDFAVPSPQNADVYFGAVRRHSNRRRVMDASRRLSRMAQDDEEPEAMLAEATAIGERLSIGGVVVPEVDVPAALERLLASKGGGGAPTGFPSIDHKICRRRGGLAKRQYTLVSAPSGEGKSSFILSVLFRALMRGERCAFGTFADLDEEEIMYRAVRFANKYGIGRLTDARDDEERRSVMDAADAVARWPWGLYDASESEGANSVEAFRAWLRKWSERHGSPTRVGLDYAQVIHTSDPRYSGHPTTANQRVAGLVRLMASKHDAAFLVGSQVTKKEDGSYQTKHASDWFDHAAMEIQVFRGQLKITKNRHGTDRCEVPTSWDPLKLVVGEMEEEV
jgi:replicative DNA helicase